MAVGKTVHSGLLSGHRWHMINETRDDHVETMSSRNKSCARLVLFNLLFNVLGQVRRFMFGHNAEQWAQLQPPAV